VIWIVVLLLFLFGWFICFQVIIMRDEQIRIRAELLNKLGEIEAVLAEILERSGPGW
jgi:hypothetical protein